MPVRILRKHIDGLTHLPAGALATNETVCGDDVIGFTNPRDLFAYSASCGFNKPWPVPIADYAPELAEFQALCNAATRVQEMNPAFCFLRGNHVSARVDDVPEAKRELAKAYVRTLGRDRRDLPLRDDGSEGAWS